MTNNKKSKIKSPLLLENVIGPKILSYEEIHEIYQRAKFGYLNNRKSHLSNNLRLTDTSPWTTSYAAIWDKNKKEVKELYQTQPELLNVVDEYSKRSALHMAVQQNNTVLVKLLLNYKVNINSKDINGMTPLHYAICNGNIEVAKLLIEHGDNLDDKDLYCKRIFLQVAVNTKNWKLVESLLEEGNYNLNTKKGKILLNRAANSSEWEVVKILLEKKIINYNFKSKKGKALLNKAIQANKWEVVKILLEKGANLNIKDNNGQTILHYAAQAGEWGFVKQLIEKGINPNSKDSNGQTILHYAAQAGEWAFVKQLITGGYNFEFNCDKIVLYKAFQSSEWELVEQLVLLRDNLNTKDNNGQNGQTILYYAISDNQYDLVKFLFDKYSYFEVQGRQGVKVLRSLISSNKWDLVKFLIEKGAGLKQVKIKNPDMYTAATLADSIAQNIECEFDLPKGQEQLFLNRLKCKLSASNISIDNCQDFMKAIDNLNLSYNLNKKIKNLIKEEQEGLLQDEAELMYKLKQSNTPMSLWLPISDLSDALEGKSLEFYKEHYPDWKDLIAEYESNNISAERKGELVSKIKNSAGAFIFALSENEMRELIKRSDKKEVSKEAKLSAIIERVLSSPILPKAAAKILSSVEYDIEKLLVEGALEELEMVQSLISIITDTMLGIEGEDILAIYSAIYEDAALEAAWEEPEKITTSSSESLLEKLKGLIELFPTDQAQDLLGRIAKSGEKLFYEVVFKPDHVGTTEVLGATIASDSCSSGAPLPAFEGES